jgi:hypothetical protein
MAIDAITIRGARTHNLKNIDVTLPRDKLIVITGLSGSGKSSLAFDTIYAEGQRRYVESLSAYARQFLSMMEKPDVDSIEGLSPAISIEQKSTSHNPRSTVGTITEIYDYLRLLFARVGTPRCPDHGVALASQTVQQMVDHTLALNPDKRFMMLAPVVKERKGEHYVARARVSFDDANPATPLVVQEDSARVLIQSLAKSNGVSTCPRGVLGQTGPDGWFRTTAKENFWRVDSLPSYFVPGYEFFDYEYGIPDKDHITAYIPYDVNLLDTMPSFEKALTEKGYVYHQPVLSDRWSHHWTKIMPAAGFHDFRNHPEIKRSYFIRYRSFPNFVGQNFSFMGKTCDDPGADNIGVELERVQRTDKLRAIYSTKYFCDAKWDDIKRPTVDLTEWVGRAAWLTPGVMITYGKIAELMPDRNYAWAKKVELKKPFSQEEREKFCNWITPFILAAEEKLNVR